MKTIKEYIEAHRIRMKQKRQQCIIGRANELYQITEYDGRLWLTFNGALICHVGLFGFGNPIQTLQEIRNLYIERNAPSYDKATDTESV